MRKVENKESIYFLAFRFIKMNKARNLIAILAIALTSVLFTSVAATSFSYVKSTQQAECRMTMDSSHMTVQDATKEEYDQVVQAVSADKSVVRYGVGRFLGSAANQELISHQTKVRYADANMAESFMAKPTTGHMPEKKNEIACSTITLNLLGITPKLGEKVVLITEDAGVEYTNEFTLCGYWTGDTTTMSQLVWVSEEYSDKIGHDLTTEDMKNQVTMDGGYLVSVWFDHTLNLEQKATDLIGTFDLPKDSTMKISTNPAFLLFEEDGFPFLGVGIIIVIILIAGFLIIYNVFNISVMTDIRSYGLLKNIGITSRQLKRIVQIQALMLSVIGIPLGMLLGYLLSNRLLGVVMADIGDAMQGAQTDTVMSTNPLIFIFAAVFSLLTVFVGCQKSSRIVKKLTPIEALKAGDGADDSYKGKRKSSEHAGAFAMAGHNVRRNLGKGISVMISIMLSLTVLNCVFTIVDGFSFKGFITGMISTDFEISKITSNLFTSDIAGVTPETIEQMKDCPDAADVPLVYCQTSECTIEGKTVYVDLYGINESAFQYMEWGGESLTWEEFNTSNKAIVHAPENQNGDAVQVGDTYNIAFTQNNVQEYLVLSEGTLPYNMQFLFYQELEVDVYVPDTVFVAETGEDNAMYACINAKEGKQEAVQDYLDKNVLSGEQTYIEESILDYKNGFQNYLNKFYVLGGSLAAILAMIGIMNYFNAMATSILTRKKELTLLEILGMTKKQIRKMLVYEGLLYVTGGLILALSLGSVLGYYMVQQTVGQIYFFDIHYTVLPSLAVFVVLCVIAALIPSYQYRKMQRETVVERIHAE